MPKSDLTPSASEKLTKRDVPPTSFLQRNYYLKLETGGNMDVLHYRVNSHPAALRIKKYLRQLLSATFKP